MLAMFNLSFNITQYGRSKESERRLLSLSWLAGRIYVALTSAQALNLVVVNDDWLRHRI